MLPQNGMLLQSLHRFKRTPPSRIQLCTRRGCNYNGGCHSLRFLLTMLLSSRGIVQFKSWRRFSLVFEERLQRPASWSQHAVILRLNCCGAASCDSSIRCPAALRWEHVLSLEVVRPPILHRCSVKQKRMVVALVRWRVPHTGHRLFSGTYSHDGYIGCSTSALGVVLDIYPWP